MWDALFTLLTIKMWIPQPFPTIQENCCLLFNLLLYFGSQYYQQYMDPQSAPLGALLPVFVLMVKVFCRALQYMQQT